MSVKHGGTEINRLNLYG